MDIKSRKFPMLLSAGIVIVIILWMLSGLGRDASAPEQLAAGSSDQAAKLLQVRIQQFTASEVLREVIISGQTQPDRTIEIRSETEGTVKQIHVERGAAVTTGSTLVSLQMRDRQSRLSEANALVQQRQLEFTALSNLKGQNFTTEVQIAESKARLESALASLDKIEQEITYTTIKAPFAGVLYDRMVEVGDFVRVGDAIARVVDLDPLIISGVVNEREVSELAVGSSGSATLVDGTRIEGTIRYLSPVADSSTRSFLIELAVPNPGYVLRGGQTAELSLRANAVKVQTLSAGLLSLADDGTIGVKVVDNEDVVQFYPVNIVGSSDQGMHVTGLPDSIRLITVGQGFVTAGQRVDPILTTSVESAASYERAN